MVQILPRPKVSLPLLGQLTVQWIVASLEFRDISLHARHNEIFHILEIALESDVCDDKRWPNGNVFSRKQVRGNRIKRMRNPEFGEIPLSKKQMGQQEVGEFFNETKCVVRPHKCDRIC